MGLEDAGLTTKSPHLLEGIRVGMSAWKINEGLYPDLHVGMERAFAIAMTPRVITGAKEHQPAAVALGSCFYHLRGKVTYAHRGVWVLHAGFPVFCEGDLPQDAVVGRWLSVETVLHLDPGTYRRTYSRRKTMPNIVRPYRITEIQRDTRLWQAWQRTENRPIRAGGKSEHLVDFLTREEGRHKDIKVTQTRAAVDDGGSAHYTLLCEGVG
jgi:hypothetical protein